MAQIDFSVVLRGGEAEGAFHRYAPGEEISGTVQLVPNEDVNSRRGVVRLRWRTEGRGDVDAGEIGEIELFQGPLRHGFPFSSDFRFSLPAGPWSYRGHYISIVWEIQVFVDVPMAVDPKHSQPFILAPKRQG